MTRTMFFATAILAAVSTLHADEITPSVAKRFQNADAKEVPNFQRHLDPLLGKLGCNGRACHGSFQGQGGFRLSLFGYDFKMDHEGLMERVDLDVPKDSYVLQKALNKDEHDGGKRFEENSWQHNLFHNWIKGGAKGAPEGVRQTLVKLDITPKEIQFAKKGETSQLKVVAVWPDGTKEDVTTLCRFQTNDSQVAHITEEGLVTSNEPGDTNVVVFYDSGVVPIPVLQPVTKQAGSNYPNTPTPTKIDELVVNKLRKIGVVQSSTCSDTDFLRRVSLDITGTLPTPSEVEAFLADKSTDKRAKKVDELLEKPAYAAWWATKICDFTGNNAAQLNNVSPMRNNTAGEWYDWVKSRVETNVAYDDLIEGIVVANSRLPGEDYEAYCKRMSDMYREKDNSFAESDGLTYYWARRNFRTPEDRAIGFAYTFLGIRIQCAQCHKHPFDQWTQDDFKQFQGFFVQTRFSNPTKNNKQYMAMIKDLGVDKLRGNDQRRELARLLEKEGKTIPFPELYNLPARATNNNAKNRKKNGKRPEPVAMAKLLGGEEINLVQQDDPRKPLMDWLRSRENKLFAKAFVNRVWASYFNVGIVEPTDDLSLANPPSNPELLDYLAEAFVENNYDMKWLHREIANSRTYQLSWEPNETNLHDERNFARAVPRRMPAEVAVDAIEFATASTEKLSEAQTDLKNRSIALPSVGRNNRGAGPYYALTIFGRSVRENNCDCDRSFEPSLLQTLYMRNDQEVLASIDRPKDGWLKQLADELELKFVPKTTSSNSKTVKKPKNYDELVERYQARLEKLKESDNKAAYKAGRKKFLQFLARYGDSIKDIEAKEDNAGDNTENANTGTQLAAADVKRVVDEAYLRTLSRHPSNDEYTIAQKYLTDADDPVDGIRSLLWALINTKEFIVNH